MCWHQHQTTKPLDLRIISEIWERWASNSNQTRAIKSHWLCAYTCEWICEFICACLTVVCMSVCVHVCVCSCVFVVWCMYTCQWLWRGQSQRNFSLLVNKQLTIKAKTYGSHRVMVSINTAQTHTHTHTLPGYMSRQMMWHILNNLKRSTACCFFGYELSVGVVCSYRTAREAEFNCCLSTNLTLFLQLH